MNVDDRLDPELAELMVAMRDAANIIVATTREDIPAMRAQRAAWPPPDLSDKVERSDREVPGDPPVPIRIHRPVGLDAPAPCIVSFHGGGYIVGTYRDDDLRHDQLIPELGYVGVSVEYRLAPETPYPGPLDDAYAALVWVHANADELGIDPDRIGVLGVSAGGGLAAGLALLARDRGEVPLAFQQLIYPMIDDRRTTPTSSWDVPVWNPASNTLGWSCYLADLFGTDAVPPYAAASRATDLGGLPSTFLAVGTLDLFCDEDIAYAQGLNHAEVPVELHVYPGAPHGFDMMRGMVEVATRCWRDQREWLARHL